MHKQFITYLSKLEVTEFLGLAKLLGVKVWVSEDGNSEPSMRPFQDVISEVLEAYNKASRKRRRQIDKILKEATKNKDSTKHVL